MNTSSAGLIGRWVNQLEEMAIAILLGLMTALTFANVVARSVFESNILWALEATTYLFAWLVLFGVSYAVKISAHLGVDAVINVLSPGWQKVFALVSVTACITFAGLLLYGGWDYWSQFYTKMSFLEVEDVPFPVAMQSLVGLVEDGEPLYENVPRYVPYFILPFGMALFLFRYLQAAWRIIRGEQYLLIASHEAEDSLDEADNAPAGEIADLGRSTMGKEG